MDGVFTPCRGTDGCVRMDGHTERCNVAVTIRPRPPASRLRYLARKLEEGTDPKVIAVQLRLIADET